MILAVGYVSPGTLCGAATPISPFFASASAQSLAQEWLNSHARTSKKYSLSQAYITLESSQKLFKE